MSLMEPPHPGPFARSPFYYLGPSRWTRSIAAGVHVKAVRDRLNRLRFGLDFPLTDGVIYVDPNDVQFIIARGKRLNGRHSAKVLGGDWDLKVRPISEQPKYISCLMRYRDGVAWQDTPIYRIMLGQIQAGQAPDACRSKEDMDSRYARLDQIAEQTRRRGRLLEQEELPQCFRREHGGINLNLGRDGRFLRSSGGNHRFAMACALGLPEIPAKIGAIHPGAVAAGHHMTLRTRPTND